MKNKLAPRRCKNCDEPYKPSREWQEFCNAACKKQFWRSGGVSIGRMRPIIREMVTEAIAADLAELLKRLTAIEERTKR
jgi:hypothetical protein